MSSYFSRQCWSTLSILNLFIVGNSDRNKTDKFIHARMVTNTETTAVKESRMIQAAALNFCTFNFLVTVFTFNPAYVAGQKDREIELLYRKMAQVPTVFRSIL